VKTQTFRTAIEAGGGVRVFAGGASGCVLVVGGVEGGAFALLMLQLLLQLLLITSS